MSNAIVKQKPGRPSKRQVKEGRKKTKKTTDAVAILDKLFGTPQSDAYMLEERERVLVGTQIYEMRTKAGMTQAALAKEVGTTASAICRLEDADYEGHSLPMLRKIAAVFAMQVELRFVPVTKKDSSARKRK